MTPNREQLLASTFVDLADTLVADFDVIDFLHTLASRSVQLLDVDAAGIRDCFKIGVSGPTRRA